MAKLDNYPVEGVVAPSRRFATLTPGDVTDLVELPKFLIVSCTSMTSDATVTIKDSTGVASTLTFVTGFNVVPLRPSRVTAATNCTVIAAY
jgi:hypothetical protein